MAASSGFSGSQMSVGQLLPAPPGTGGAGPACGPLSTCGRMYPRPLGSLASNANANRPERICGRSEMAKTDLKPMPFSPVCSLAPAVRAALPPAAAALLLAPMLQSARTSRSRKPSSLQATARPSGAASSDRAA